MGTQPAELRFFYSAGLSFPFCIKEQSRQTVIFHKFVGPASMRLAP